MCGWCWTLIWEFSVIIVTNTSLFFLFLLLVLPLDVCSSFYNCLTVLGYAVVFFFHLSPLYFSVFKYSMAVSPSSEILFSVMSSLLTNPSKAFSCVLQCFLSLVFLFLPFFFSDFHLSAYIVHLFLHSLFYPLGGR